MVPRVVKNRALEGDCPGEWRDYVFMKRESSERKNAALISLCREFWKNATKLLKKQINLAESKEGGEMGVS